MYRHISESSKPVWTHLAYATERFARSLELYEELASAPEFLQVNGGSPPTWEGQDRFDLSDRCMSNPVGVDRARQEDMRGSAGTEDRRLYK